MRRLSVLRASAPVLDESYLAKVTESVVRVSIAVVHRVLEVRASLERLLQSIESEVALKEWSLRDSRRDSVLLASLLGMVGVQASRPSATLKLRPCRGTDGVEPLSSGDRSRKIS